MKNLSFLLAIFLLFQTATFAKNKILVEVPMKFRGSMPAVEVMVNGQGPFLFAIDTGAQGKARMNAKLGEKLKLKKVGERLAADPSGKNPITMDVVMANSIKIGNLEFTNIEAPMRNYNRIPTLTKIDGIIGLDLFRDYLVTLDFPKKTIRIEKRELPKTNGSQIINFESSRGIPSIDLKVGNQKIKAHIDSGNMVGGFILPTKIVEKLPLIGEPKIVGRARTVSNVIEIKQAQLKGNIQFGKFKFKQPFVTFPALREANIGSKILREFALTFDQKNGRLKLKRTKLPKKKSSKMPKSVSKDYVGKYGIRTILEKEGSLYIQREGGPALKLKQTGKDEFTLERIPNARIKFVRNDEGKITEMKVLNPRGEWEVSKKANN